MSKPNKAGYYDRHCRVMTIIAQRGFSSRQACEPFQAEQKALGFIAKITRYRIGSRNAFPPIYSYQVTVYKKRLSQGEGSK